MVLVASIALGSSTYAWFVSNNHVTATTSTISAQSNAPFLKIVNKATLKYHQHDKQKTRYNKHR